MKISAHPNALTSPLISQLAPPMCYNRLGFSPIGNAIL